VKQVSNKKVVWELSTPEDGILVDSYRFKTLSPALTTCILSKGIFHFSVEAYLSYINPLLKAAGMNQLTITLLVVCPKTKQVLLNSSLFLTCETWREERTFEIKNDSAVAFITFERNASFILSTLTVQSMIRQEVPIAPALPLPTATAVMEEPVLAEPKSTHYLPHPLVYCSVVILCLVLLDVQIQVIVLTLINFWLFYNLPKVLKPNLTLPVNKNNVLPLTSKLFSSKCTKV
jgi:hypothetical protein